jgi:hypothetical protein
MILHTASDSKKKRQGRLCSKNCIYTLTIDYLYQHVTCSLICLLFVDLLVYLCILIYLFFCLC